MKTHPRKGRELSRRELLKFAGASAGATLMGGISTSLMIDKPALPLKVPRSVAKRPNIVLVVLDTVRADHLSCYGHQRRTTPNIDRFATKSRRYNHCWSTSSWTLPSHAAMFTGLSGSSHGVTWKQHKFVPKHTTLAAQLKNVGYQTIGISSNPYLTAYNGFDRGFESYAIADPLRTKIMSVAQLVFHYSGWKKPYSAALSMHSGIQKWFCDSYDPQTPFFLFLNYIEAHQPYTPHWSNLKWASEALVNKWRWENLRTTFERYILSGRDTLSDAEIEELEILYDEEVRYVDHKVGELITFFEDNGLLDNTVFIITADHGEHFGEHHQMGHIYFLYEPLIRVPLLIQMPGLETGEEEGPVQNHDIYPTILEAAGIDWQPTAGHTCRSLSHPADPTRLCVAEYLAPCPALVLNSPDPHIEGLDISRFLRTARAVRSGHWKLIRYSDDTLELYQLADDPLEQVDLATSRPDEVERLQQALDGWLRTQELPAPTQHQEAPGMKQLSREEQEALRTLGYIQ